MLSLDGIAEIVGFTFVMLQMILIGNKFIACSWLACLIACGAYSIVAVHHDLNYLLAQQGVIILLALRGLWKLRG